MADHNNLRAKEEGLYRETLKRIIFEQCRAIRVGYEIALLKGLPDVVVRKGHDYPVRMVRANLVFNVYPPPPLRLRVHIANGPSPPLARIPAITLSS